MVAVCMALVSLPVAAEVWQPITAKGDLDYLVDSVHRIGTHVYLIDRGTVNSPQGPLKFEAPIEFDCSQHALRMAWGDVLVGGRAPQRSYGKSFGHYAAMPFVSAPASAYGEAILQWGCHLPVQPERLVNIGHSGGDKLIQIDTRSINKSGEYTSFWTRYDYPQIQFDPPYDAPYDSKREFVTVNCKTGRFRISVGYDFTPEGAVTDNMIARDDAEWSSPSVARAVANAVFRLTGEEGDGYAVWVGEGGREGGRLRDEFDRGKLALGTFMESDMDVRHVHRGAHIPQHITRIEFLVRLHVLRSRCSGGAVGGHGTQKRDSFAVATILVLLITIRALTTPLMLQPRVGLGTMR
ncbi:hypothetical protein PQR12_23025 [Paraburkholderia nemoris]|uniref:surface-adhesin E family protein n=1 Tax=Paraburkholderia nemoris TaxID=2793076 RepID=UPI0038B702C1